MKPNFEKLPEDMRSSETPLTPLEIKKLEFLMYRRKREGRVPEDQEGKLTSLKDVISEAVGESSEVQDKTWAGIPSEVKEEMKRAIGAFESGNQVATNFHAEQAADLCDFSRKNLERMAEEEEAKAAEVLMYLRGEKRDPAMPENWYTNIDNNQENPAFILYSHISLMYPELGVRIKEEAVGRDGKPRAEMVSVWIEGADYTKTAEILSDLFGHPVFSLFYKAYIIDSGAVLMPGISTEMLEKDLRELGGNFSDKIIKFAALYAYDKLQRAYEKGNFSNEAFKMKVKRAELGGQVSDTIDIKMYVQEFIQDSLGQ